MLLAFFAKQYVFLDGVKFFHTSFDGLTKSVYFIVKNW